MFSSWGTAISRFRWLILALAVAFLAVAGVWGTGVFAKMSGSSSLNDPAAESQRINRQVLADFGPQSQDLVALYSSSTATVDDPQFAEAVRSAEARARGLAGVAAITSYYDSQAPSFVSTDKHETYIAVRLVAHTSDGRANKIAKALRTSTAPSSSATQGTSDVKTLIGGTRAVDLAINGRVPADIGKAEGIGTPILLILLLLVFGSVVAASMPVLIGGFAVLGAFTLVRVLTLFTTVSIFSLNIITILGMGLAVDYGLFMVSRFREELDRGRTVPDAVSRTVATAGRTVAVSGVLVALALSSLMIFPQVLLHSMGLGGAAAVLVAMLASLTVLPALLAVLGHRVDAGRLPWSRRRRLPSVTGAVVGLVSDRSENGRWGRIAQGVMRRPVPVLIGIVVLLGVLSAPFARVHFGGIDERMLPPGTQSRVVSERLAADFTGAGIRPIQVLVDNASASDTSAFQARIAALPGVTGTVIAAQRPAGTPGTDNTLVSVHYNGDASSTTARRIVERVRALPRPSGATVMVGGTSAEVVDQLHSLSSRLPWMALLVAGITFLVLAIAFGSVIVPLKAIVMNLISIAAAFGVVTWIFADGHLSGLLGFTPTGYVEASQPILMVAILFGLSMDYEVFLLSRIRERWDELGNNTAAVVSGVQRTGWLISTAAVLLCVVVGSFATSGITFVKMIGVGMVVALLVDATLVRLLLVPATMRLLGRHNWWSPGPLRRLYGRYGVREEDPVEPVELPERAYELVARVS